MNGSVPFINNPMLANNPLFYGSIRDPAFYNRVNMTKMEQLKKVKNVKELGLSNEQLSGYIICPIKVEHMDKAQYNQLLNERESTYITHNKNGKHTVPKVLKEWYDGRKNTPYKNILKDQNYEKEFKKKEDLIVHKITQLDKDKIRLANEYETLARLLEKHDGELKLIYSASEETKHAEKFNYVNKYKNRIKYDPKNYDELKQFYRKTQKKIKRENKRIDEMIELLLVSDQISKEDMNEIQKSAEYIDNCNDDMINMNAVFEKGERNLEKQLEKELKKELGKEAYNEIMKELENDSDSHLIKSKVKVTKVKVTHKIEESDEEDNDKSNNIKKYAKSEDSDDNKKVKSVCVNNKKQRSEDSDDDKKVKSVSFKDANDETKSEVKSKPKVRVTKISEKNKSNEKSSVNTIGYVTEDEMDKYRNRK